MNIKISLELVIYVIVSILLLLWLIRNLNCEEYGFFTKKKGEIGVGGFVAIMLWIFYTLIWGGIFWW